MLLHSETEARSFVAKRCSPEAMAKLDVLSTCLAEENASQNLVSGGSLDNIWLRHFADSAQLLDHVSRETGPWLDLGTGAGFPGLVIAAMRPERELVLIESRRLRIQWLERMVARLELPRCQVIGQDVRKVATMKAAVISARAFAPLDRLIEISARFSTNATEWVLPKGRSAAQEIARLPISLRERFHVKQSVTNADAGILVANGVLEAEA